MALMTLGLLSFGASAATLSWPSASYTYAPGERPAWAGAGWNQSPFSGAWYRYEGAGLSAGACARR